MVSQIAVWLLWELSFFRSSGCPGDEKLTAEVLRRRLDGDQASHAASHSLSLPADNCPILFGVQL